ncbi:hypothetical protein KTN05_16205 [Paracoccus sp. Z118]|uniref:hypothetical protein n=1 Tax=Paracoccus sp. Z118 TaxID=2851017 RepID=UPI001C2BFFAD|nr:hypothetical protein [Paracoccus sp. Z118]MBV0893356.1 hypothetical protein [Paracoccus sp. Z118]
MQHLGGQRGFGSPAADFADADAERYAANTVGVDAVARFTVRWSSFTAGITHAYGAANGTAMKMKA